MARGDGRHPRILRALGRVDLLILDDWGLELLDAAARHDLLEILEDRYGRRSTLVNGQLPVDQWHALIGLLRKAAARTVEAVWAAIGQALTAFTPPECATYFENAGYAST